MKKYRLIGFLNLFSVVPDFVYPVFENDGLYYFQDEYHGKVIDFVLVKSSVHSMITKTNEYKQILGIKKAVLEIGSKSIYSFQIEKNKIVCGEDVDMLKFFQTYTTHNKAIKKEILAFNRELLNSESIKEYRRNQKLENKIKKYFGIGRVKKSIAKVYLVPGTGNITINKRPIDDYFGLATLKAVVRQPLAATNTINEFDAIVMVKGGGFTGQAGAIRHGISKALLQVDVDYRPALKKNLTRNPHMKERKKYGFKAARRKHQLSRSNRINM